MSSVLFTVVVGLAVPIVSLYVDGAVGVGVEREVYGIIAFRRVDSELTGESARTPPTPAIADIDRVAGPVVDASTIFNLCRLQWWRVELQSVNGQRAFTAPTPTAMFGRLVPALIIRAIWSMNGVTLRIDTLSGSLPFVGKAVAAVVVVLEVVVVVVRGVLVAKLSSANAVPCWALKMREARTAKQSIPPMLAILLTPHIVAARRMQ